jgi:hypothetical protein
VNRARPLNRPPRLASSSHPKTSRNRDTHTPSRPPQRDAVREFLVPIILLALLVPLVNLARSSSAATAGSAAVLAHAPRVLPLNFSAVLAANAVSGSGARAAVLIVAPCSSSASASATSASATLVGAPLPAIGAALAAALAVGGEVGTIECAPCELPAECGAESLLARVAARTLLPGPAGSGGAPLVAGVVLEAPLAAAAPAPIA